MVVEIFRHYSQGIINVLLFDPKNLLGFIKPCGSFVYRNRVLSIFSLKYFIFVDY